MNVMIKNFNILKQALNPWFKRFLFVLKPIVASIQCKSGRGNRVATNKLKLSKENLSYGEKGI
jgi:hypothetical protein